MVTIHIKFMNSTSWLSQIHAYVNKKQLQLQDWKMQVTTLNTSECDGENQFVHTLSPHDYLLKILNLKYHN